jgi:hypothetical protein
MGGNYGFRFATNAVQCGQQLVPMYYVNLLGA